MSASSEALEQYVRFSGDTTTVLHDLEARLAQLTKVTAPIAGRVSTLCLADQNIAAVQAAADELLKALETSRKIEAQLRFGPSEDLELFLEQLRRLEEAINALAQHTKLASAHAAYEHALQVRGQAMSDCEADFLSSLTQAATGVLPSAGWLRDKAANLPDALAEPVQLEVLPEATLERMSRLAQTMMSAQHVSALDAYVQARARFGDTVMRLAGYEPVPSAVLQAQGGEQLEKAATSWGLQLRVMVLLAASEQALAHRVWVSPHVEMVSQKVLARLMRPILDQGEDIAEGRRIPERVFALLDMHRNMMEVLPFLEPLLLSAGTDAGQKKSRADRTPGSGDGSLTAELRSLYAALQLSARNVFADFEDTVANDQGKVQVLDGTIHPLCAHTLSYLKRLFTYPNCGQVLFNLQLAAVKGAAKAVRTADADSTPLARTSAQLRAMGGSVTRILGNLLDNLEAKSGGYKDPALAHIFLMNNTHFIAATVGGSGGDVPLSSLLGADWVTSQRETVQTLAAEYRRLAWDPLITQLQRAVSGEDVAPSDTTKNKLWLKDKFNAFNVSLETIYTTQCAWTVPDVQLRASLRRAVSQALMPVYKKFWKKFSTREFSSTPSKYLRYSPEDVEAMVDGDLFGGQLVTLQKVKIKKQRGAG